jgi:hypothetical protein
MPCSADLQVLGIDLESSPSNKNTAIALVIALVAVTLAIAFYLASTSPRRR